MKDAIKQLMKYMSWHCHLQLTKDIKILANQGYSLSSANSSFTST